MIYHPGKAPHDSGRSDSEARQLDAEIGLLRLQRHGPPGANPSVSSVTYNVAGRITPLLHRATPRLAPETSVYSACGSS